MRYIEVVGGIGTHRLDCELTDEVLHDIGKLTRENIIKWLERWSVPGDFPIEDVNVVIDDIEIPWATKEGRDRYASVMGKQE